MSRGYNNMSDLFTSYEQDLIAGITSISKKTSSIGVQTSRTKKELAFSDIREDQRQCEKLIKLMETELNSIDVQLKFEFSKKTRQYKKDLDDCRKKLIKAEDEYAFQKNKQMLIGAQLDEEKSMNKEKLIKQGQMLSDTNYKLKDSVKLIRDTEDMSNNIQIELVSHTDRMQKNKDSLLTMQDDIGSSQKRINSIIMRIRKHKIVMVGAIGLVTVITVVALIVHFSK